MPKWVAELDRKLFLAIIEATDAKLTVATWISVAGLMGDGFSSEACRQHFQHIQRSLKSAASHSTTDNAGPLPTKTANKSATNKKNAKSAVLNAAEPVTSTSAGVGKGRKRKAAIPDAANDENQATALPVKKAKKDNSTKAKEEGEASRTQDHDLNAEVFKAEEAGDGPVDLEHVELYGDGKVV